jgi:hypothetical protein
MKRVYIIIVIIEALLTIRVEAQSTQQNLNKYWYYRQRLRDYFVVVDPNDGFGTNIPFSNILKKTPNDVIKMGGGDGNGAMQHYIGVLATEYRLLADNGQTVEAANTKNE